MTEELFARPDIEARHEPGGVLLLRSRTPPADYPRSLAVMLRDWAPLDPWCPLIARRGLDGAWITRSYDEVAAAADALGQALLERGLGPERPLLVLSGNSIEHFLLTMACHTAGVPVAPVSVAYLLASTDHERIRAIAALLTPGAVFADDGERYAVALRALEGVPTIVCTGPGGEALSDLLASTPGEELGRAKAGITPDSVAKILFTSGSTGTPKEVLNTHRMLCSNQAAMRQVWSFLTVERSVLADWRPWSHTFGGDHNLDMVLANGGTLYLDEGSPSPEGIKTTIANLTELRPTVCFNVPAGWAALTPALESDTTFAHALFSRLRLMFNASAGLPAALRTRLESLARQVTGRAIPVTMSWGTTETAPAVTTAHHHFTDTACIGVPIPGAELKLVPEHEEGTYELRVRGPMITPGYLDSPGETAAAFDADGFYRPGDAVTLADADEPNAGLVFRGRLAEDFKLATGTFVRVGPLRTRLLSAAPVLADAVVTGENRDRIAALAWLNHAEVAALLGDEPQATGEVVWHAGLAEHLSAVLTELGTGAGSASRISGLVLLATPPGLDTGEITDKGYLNQRRVLGARVNHVESLYTDPLPRHVITPQVRRKLPCSTQTSPFRPGPPGPHRSRNGRDRWPRSPASISPPTSPPGRWPSAGSTPPGWPG
jgi:feruloyl-CoA synthase